MNPGETGKGLTPKGKESRARLVKAARTVFEEDGFLDARITDISAAAGLGHGSFYTYFNSKEEIFGTLMDEVFSEAYYSSTSGAGLFREDPAAAIAAANQRSYEFRIKNRRILRIFDEVASIHPEFTAIRARLRKEFLESYTGALKSLQEQGAMRSDIDPYHAAAALGAMVDESLRWWLGRGEAHDEAVALATVQKIWVRGLGIDESGTARNRRQRRTGRGERSSP
jgi:AcrR family transcriptional regulator